jgi:hypothetical protein
MNCRGSTPWAGLVGAIALLMSSSVCAMKLKPFDSPPPSIDPAKIAVLKPGTTVNINYDEILMVGTKGYVITKIGPKNPIPSDIQPAAPGIELRLRGYGYLTGLKPVDFMTRVSGEQRIVTAYLGVFADNGRVAACGYYLRKDNQPFAADFFFDLRSYVDVGGAFRLPAVFIQDETSTPKRSDGTLPARCVDTNIEWDQIYLTMPISLHLVDSPLAYEWQMVASSPAVGSSSAVPPQPEDTARPSP